ncbi:GHKL domain-containing protein [candidate division KSB1 bacterium]|nr:GHKL domain-containing protein [candidate division KSB1 bacterium]
MVFKNYRVQIIVKLFFLFVLLFFSCYIWFNSDYKGALFVLAAVIIWQVYSLFHLIDTTNFELAQFFQAVKYSDFTRFFSGKVKGKSYSELYRAFNDVMDHIEQSREEKEEQYRYMQTIVQHIGIGLIVFDGSGSVDLVNNAARRILNITAIRNIHKLEKIDPSLVKRITSLKHGDRDIFKLKINDELQQMMIFVTDFIMHRKNYRLISFQNIQSELEEKELDAWQKLIRVLTHEIMNSITPISSLASTANELLAGHPGQFSKNPHCDEVIQDIGNAIETIEKRSKGLLHFVENYRKLIRIPKPEYQMFGIRDLFDRIELLFQKQLTENSVVFQKKIDPPNLELMADPDLVEQVLINLVKNALEAVQNINGATIELNAGLDNYSKPVIRISDNGVGIRKDILDNIFIPFFTTKSNGSGIGLSLSRQIMRLHGGTISVKSDEASGTVFQLRFK